MSRPTSSPQSARRSPRRLGCPPACPPGGRRAVGRCGVEPRVERHHSSTGPFRPMEHVCPGTRAMFTLSGIIGSFAFVPGYLSAMAAKDPLKHRIVVMAFVEFFILRDINRHLYCRELYTGFGVSPLVNDLATVFFGVRAIILAVLTWVASRQGPSA